jgi:hypothetical protein
MLRAASVVVLAAASLAGGRSSIEHHDATLAQHDITSRQLSQTPDGCVASTDNQVATVDSLQNYDLTFTMELASDWSIDGTWQSVFHIGDTNGQRLPGLWFHPSGGLHVVQSHSDCDACCCQWGVDQTAGAAFEKDKTYEIKVVVENNQMAVYVDGALVGTASGSATYAATDAAVYVGDPWYDAAKVTLSDITLSDIALADTCRANVAAMTATFVHVDQEMSWTDAREYCRTHHHDLASIHSASENAEVAALCPVWCWLGGSDLGQEGTWTWSDGSAWDYENWDTGQPNNLNGPEDYLNIWGAAAGANREHGKWNDLSDRSGTQTFVCRETPATVPCTPAVPVEGSLTFTVGTYGNAQGINGHLYVKLWSGTTPIPMSSTVSVSAIYPGSCSTNNQDDILDNWSGGSGWLKLDNIDVSTTGATSSQSLGSLDPTLPLTHIELYYTENNALQVGDLSIQVGDTSYGLPAGWSNANHPSGDGWLETDQSCVWWMKIEMVWLDGPVGGPPCDVPHGDKDDSNNKSNDSLAGILGGVGAILVVGIFIFAMMKRRKPTKPPSEAAPSIADLFHEPTAPPQPDLAPIKATALEMMTEETAEFAPEAASLPPGHVTGAQAAAMARRVTVVRTETMTGREAFDEIFAVEPAPPPTGAYSPEPEC